MFFSPSIPILLDVLHILQKSDGECLAACVAMVCEYRKVAYRYKHLVRTLNIKDDVGTPFYNIQNLRKSGLHIDYQTLSTLEKLYECLCQDSPCIVSVQTFNLPHWKKVDIAHAVVLVGMDQEFVYLNDPAFPTDPIQTPIGEFDLAWLANDEKFAVLSK